MTIHWISLLVGIVVGIFLSRSGLLKGFLRY